MFSGDAFLQKAPQFDLHAVVSMGPVVHQQEVGVVVVEAGQSALTVDVHQVMCWETTLWRRRKRRKEEPVCYAGEESGSNKQSSSYL